MITIHKHNYTMPVETFLFPGGEVGVKLKATQYDYLHGNGNHASIVARITNSNELMQLALANDALERMDTTPVHLVMPYVPYARQDRVCVEGESFSLKVFANLINSMGFDRVTIFDPHSDVCAGVFNRLKIITQQQVVEKNDVFAKRVLRGVRFVSPDMGASKKTAAIANYFGHKDFIRCEKVRDLPTGRIKETVVHADNLASTDCVIVDDICDGGRTFIELARILKERGAEKVILYVTHGIFSNGTGGLYASGIDEIYTTNSFYDVWPGGCDPTHTFDLFSQFAL